MSKRILLRLVMVISGVVFTLLIPNVSLAIEIDNPLGPDSDFTTIVDRIIELTFTISVVVAPLMIALGALLFATAGGSVERVSQAKKIIIWTIIGFVVVLLARGIIEIVRNIFGL